MKKTPFLSHLNRYEAIGIDVSKAELTLAGLEGQGCQVMTLPNTTAAIRGLTAALREAAYTGPVLCEATGHYHLNLAVLCHEAGVPLIVINPLQSSKHSKASIRKTKTDAQDARLLAAMCLTERELPRPADLTRERVRINLLRGQLAALEKQLQRQRQSVNQYRQTCEVLGLPLTDAQQALLEQPKELARLKKRLETELTELAAALVDEARMSQLRGIPGFSAPVSALVGLLDTRVKSADAWVAYVGLDVSVRQSGTWNGRGRLTKRGNAYLRKRLFQAAWGACLNYEDYRSWYDQLKKNGRKHAEAVCIIARKLLRIAYYVSRADAPYDSKKVFRNAVTS